MCDIGAQYRIEGSGYLKDEAAAERALPAGHASVAVLPRERCTHCTVQHHRSHGRALTWHFRGLQTTSVCKETLLTMKRIFIRMEVKFKINTKYSFDNDLFLNKLDFYNLVLLDPSE